MRSRPIPVSTCFAGSDLRDPSGSRLNWMNTLFQISRTFGSSPLTREAASRPPILGLRGQVIIGGLVFGVRPPASSHVIKPGIPTTRGGKSLSVRVCNDRTSGSPIIALHGKIAQQILLAP